MIFSSEIKKDKSMPINTVPVSGKNEHKVKNYNEKFRCQQKKKKRNKTPKKQQQTKPMVFKCIHVYSKLNYIT